MDSLGQKLKQRRRGLGLSSKEVASASGVSTAHIARIEKGQRYPSAKILKRLAVPLGYSEEEIFKMGGYLTVGASIQKGLIEYRIKQMMILKPEVALPAGSLVVSVNYCGGYSIEDDGATKPECWQVTWLEPAGAASEVA